jgi:hypothetical protein
MGNASTKNYKTKKDLQEEKLQSVALHEGGSKYALLMPVAPETTTLWGKSIVEDGRGGYAYFQGTDDKNPVVKIKAHGFMGLTGTLVAKNEPVAEIVIVSYLKKGLQ